MSKHAAISLTVDAVVFGYKPKEGLFVLLVKRKNKPFKGDWALPGGFVDQDEALEKAVVRELQEETGIKVNYLEQLYTFGDPGRDPRGRTVSVAYYGLVKPDLHKVVAADDADEAQWFKTDDLPKLAFDHKKILKYALTRLSNKISYEPVGFELLDKAFTLPELRRLYEALYGKELDRRNFEKKIMRLGILKDLKEKVGGMGRPGNLYAFDKKKYFELKEQGIHFEVRTLS